MSAPRSTARNNLRVLVLLILAVAAMVLVAWQLGSSWSLVFFTAGLAAVTIALVQATGRLARASERLSWDQRVADRRKDLRAALDASIKVIAIPPVAFAEVIRVVPSEHPFFDDIYEIAKYTTWFANWETVFIVRTFAGQIDALRAGGAQITPDDAVKQLADLKKRLLPEMNLFRQSLRSNMDERLPPEIRFDN